MNWNNSIYFPHSEYRQYVLFNNDIMIQQVEARSRRVKLPLLSRSIIYFLHAKLDDGGLFFAKK